MKKAAIIIAEGFEEGETFTIVDIIRRAELHCDIVGLKEEVTGGHKITIQADKVLSEDILDYDMIILPGGYPGVAHLKESELLLSILKDMAKQNKYIGAMCAAPVVLEKADLLINKKYTAYLGYDQKIKQGKYLEDEIVLDEHLVTSRGPATAYAFAYKLVDLLGGNSLAVKERMLYYHAFNVREEC